MKGRTQKALKLITMGLSLLFCACSIRNSPPLPSWSSQVSPELDALGYRNWLIIAESSFPIYSRPGVRTIVVDAEAPEVLGFVVDYYDRTEKARPSFTTARELTYVKNDNAPGIDEFRLRLKKALHGHELREMDHRSLALIAQNDSSKFVVLVIKTKTALPYTNIFIELDSGYWDRASEDQLRQEMKLKEDKKTILLPEHENTSQT